MVERGRMHAVVTRTGPSGRLGRLRMAGRVDDSRGAQPGRTVRFPSFGCTYLLRGSGRYRDSHHDVALGPGSLVWVLPGNPHWYGAVGAETWDEVFLVFDGPVFETARATGLLSPRRPVQVLAPVRRWGDRIDRFRTRPAPRSVAGADAEVCELLGLVTELVGAASGEQSGAPGDWFERSVEALSSALERHVDLREVAASVGVPYETWRRRFRDRAGRSPAAFRLARRLDAAAQLATGTSLSTREMAAVLGFADEQHLIRHFRATFDTTPRRYRDARR